MAALLAAAACRDGAPVREAATPTVSGPTTSGPTTSGPTSSGPTTSGPTTSGPSTSGPGSTTTTVPRPTTTRRPYEACPPDARPAVAPYVPGTLPPITLVSWDSAQTCVVAVDTATARVLGAVYTSPEGWHGEWVFDPSGTSIVVTERSGCTTRMVRVDLATGSRTDLGPGSLAALRDDGAALAYRPTADDPAYANRPVARDEACLRNVVVIRDLTTGDERTLEIWRVLPFGRDVSPYRLDWSPDGRSLAGTYWGADVTHVMLLNADTGEAGTIEVSSAVRGWVTGGECCGIQAQGWTPQNRLVTMSYPYVGNLQLDRPNRIAIATGDVHRGDDCPDGRSCVEIDTNISRDDPDHEGDLARAGGTTLRVWGGVSQLLGPNGVIDLPGGGARWPANAMHPPFD